MPAIWRDMRVHPRISLGAGLITIAAVVAVILTLTDGGHAPASAGYLCNPLPGAEQLPNRPDCRWSSWALQVLSNSPPTVLFTLRAWHRAKAPATSPSLNQSGSCLAARPTFLLGRRKHQGRHLRVGVAP